MADRKISDLTALTTPASGDYLPIVDISEASAANKNKRITIEELLRGAPDGTAGAPGIGFESDPNTGIYSPGADALGLVTAGTERLRITSAGLVGIGTSAPDTALHLASTSPVLRFENPTTTSTTGTSMGKIEWETRDASAPGVIGYIDVVDSNNFGTAFDMQLATGVSGAATTKVTIKADGKVGIGTTSPSYALDVSGQIRAAANATLAQLRLERTGTSTGHSWLGAQSDALLAVLDSSFAEKMRLDSSGRLLVGTSSARADIGSNQTAAVQTESTVNGLGFFSAYNQNNAFGAVLALAKSRGTTVGSNTIVQSGDQIGGINFYGADGVDTALAGSIECYVDGTPGADDMPGRLVFSTTADGAGSPTERMRIRENGKVWIGTTSDIRNNREQLVVKGTNVEGVLVQSNGLNYAGYIYRDADSAAGTHYIGFWENSSGTNVGAITHNNTNTTYATTSDYRLKENVAPIAGACDRLNQLKPCRFNFIADPDNTVDGFLAHEAQAVVPESVIGQKDAVNEDGTVKPQGIDQSKLVPLLTAALQEAIGEIESLKARVAALEGA